MPISEVKQVNKFFKSFVVLLLSRVVIKQKVGDHIVDRRKIGGVRSNGESWYVDSDAILEVCQNRSEDVDI